MSSKIHQLIVGSRDLYKVEKELQQLNCWLVATFGSGKNRVNRISCFNIAVS
jgi:hypothetical protein